MHTHARSIVEKFIHRHLRLMHSARRVVLAAAVNAVMGGHLLSLSRLARGVMGQSTQKAALKRVDRFIGNRRIGEEAQLVAAALLRTLSACAQPLVIAVDWTSVAPGGAFVELRAVATHAGMGRGLTLYQQVYPMSELGNPQAERALLGVLHASVPPGVPVIIVSDAGFRRPWFMQVQRLGWAWIGRVRCGVSVSRNGADWDAASAWFAKATGKPVRWADCRLARKHRFACDFVLYRSRLRGTRRYARAGHGATPKARCEARARAREPWLLAHSTQLRNMRADEIVALYRRRMQIEENFRDSKSTPLGDGLELSQSRCPLRLHALLLIGTVAAFLLWHIGQLAEAEGLHQRFKSTTRLMREVSVITLAKLLWRLTVLPLTEFAIQSLHERLGLQT